MKKSKTKHKATEDLTPEEPASPNVETLTNEVPTDTEEAQANAPPEDKALDELTAQTVKAQENWDRFLRVTAEFDNFRKRAAREKEEAVRYANHKLLERLLPVLDSFDMATTAASAQNGGVSQSLKEGIQLVLQQFKTVLTESGLEEIGAHGKPFDPNLHEAVSQLETDEVEEGHVAQQLRKGYLLRDRLVRPSIVIVAKRPAA